MDERQITGLVRAAMEVDELEAADSGQPTSDLHPSRHRSSRKWWAMWTTVGAVAALVALVISRPESPPAIVSAKIDWEPVRDMDAGLVLTVKCDKPAHLSVIAIDERNERWLLRADKTSDSYDRYILDEVQFTLHRFPRPDSPQSGAPIRNVFLVALSKPASAELLLQIIQDPIVSANSNGDEILDKLSAIEQELQRRFRCSVWRLDVPP